MTKVSVIVYLNSKRGYLKLLKSLLAQTLADIEIILLYSIKDNLPKTIYEFLKSDKRIKMYKTKAFKAESYNFAIKKAKSDYIVFLNSNNNLKADSLEILYRQISENNDDIVVFNNHGCDNFLKTPLCKRILAYGSMFNIDNIEKIPSPCQLKPAIYNKKFLIKNNLFFRESKILNEKEFFYKVLINASKISEIGNISDSNPPKDKINCPKTYEKIIQKLLNEKHEANYEKTLKRLKNKKKLRVLFLVNEISKWKGQSLFDLMKKSDKFDPAIVLTISDIQVNYPKEKKLSVLKENEDFFQKRKITCLSSFDIKKEKATDLAQFKPDIVFYEQPYNLDKLQDVLNVSRYALTMYFPYYIASFKNLPLDCGRFFHNGLFRFYVLNNEFKKEYSLFMKNKGKNIKVAGHPMLDNIKFKSDYKKDDYVIYAPHWSIKHPKNPNEINISTFLNYGEIILEYATNHPEINWAFKPHPTLKTALEKVWNSKKRAEEYFKAWEKIAYCSYDSNYLELFNKSKLLITDCNSFLVEYFCTGKPVIHLISNDTKLESYEYNKKILNSFYKVNTVDELFFNFSKLIKDNIDPLKQKRLKLLSEYGYINSNFSKKIIKDLIKITK